MSFSMRILLILAGIAVGVAATVAMMEQHRRPAPTRDGHVILMSLLGLALGCGLVVFGIHARSAGFIDAYV